MIHIENDLRYFKSKLKDTAIKEIFVANSFVQNIEPHNPNVPWNHLISEIGPNESILSARIMRENN